MLGNSYWRTPTEWLFQGPRSRFHAPDDVRILLEGWGFHRSTGDRRKIFRTIRKAKEIIWKKNASPRCSEGEVVLVYMVGRWPLLSVGCFFAQGNMQQKSRGSLFLSEKSWDASCEKSHWSPKKNSNASFVPKSRPWRLPSGVKKQQSILDGAIRGEFGHAGGCLGQTKGVFPEIFKITVDASEIPKANNSDVSKTPWF